MRALLPALLAAAPAAACPVVAGFRIDAPDAALGAAWARVGAAAPALRVTRIEGEVGAATLFASARLPDMAAAARLADAAAAAGARPTQPPPHASCAPAEAPPRPGVLQATAILAAPVEPDTLVLTVQFPRAPGGPRLSDAARAFIAQAERHARTMAADADTIPPTEEAFLVAHGRMAAPVPAVEVRTGDLQAAPALEAEARAAGAASIARSYDVGRPATVAFLLERNGPDAQRTALTLAHAAAAMLGATATGRPALGDALPVGAHGNAAVLAFDLQATASLTLAPVPPTPAVRVSVACHGAPLACLRAAADRAHALAAAVGLHAGGLIGAAGPTAAVPAASVTIQLQ